MLKKVLIIGYGKSGQWLALFLKNKQIDYVIYDEQINEINPNLNNVDAAFISPGICKAPQNRHRIFNMLAKYCIPIMSDYDILYYFKNSSKFIGITGTAGKTTTTMLISHLLKSANINHLMCGNMGIDIFQNFDETNLYVMELGAAQLELLQYMTFNLAAITNIVPDHIDFFECQERYISAKLNILKKNYTISQEFHLGSGCPECYKNTLNLSDITKEMIPNDQLHFEHNFNNVKIAFSIAQKLGCNYEHLASLKNFKFPPYRQVEIFHDEYNVIINDSKATNIPSVEAALNNYNNIYWIVGGKFKTFDFTFIDKYLNKIKECICFGLNKLEIFQYLTEKGIKCYIVQEFQDISTYIYNYLQINEKKSIIFSPLGQSYDMFTSYEERGKIFSEMVKKIVNN